MNGISFLSSPLERTETSGGVNGRFSIFTAAGSRDASGCHAKRLGASRPGAYCFFASVDALAAQDRAGEAGQGFHGAGRDLYNNQSMSGGRALVHERG